MLSNLYQELWYFFQIRKNETASEPRLGKALSKCKSDITHSSVRTKQSEAVSKIEGPTARVGMTNMALSQMTLTRSSHAHLEASIQCKYSVD